MLREWILATVATALVGSPYPYWPDAPAEAPQLLALAQIPPERPPAPGSLFRGRYTAPVRQMLGLQLPTQPGQPPPQVVNPTNWAFVGYGDDALGLALVPVEPALKQQLQIPENQGVLVSSLTGGGPADLAGLRANDILLSLADQPIGEPGDLVKHLKAAGEKELTLVLLRGGERTELKVRPIYRVSLAQAARKPVSEYYVGVQATPLDPTFRTHLKEVGQNQGLLVGEVVEGSPAAKAGVKTGDIMLSLADRPLADLAGLKQALQSTAGKPTKLVLLRGGKTETVEVVAELREVTQTTQDTFETSYWVSGYPMRPGTTWERWTPNRVQGYGIPGPQGVLLTQPAESPIQLQQSPIQLQQRLDALGTEVKELNALVDQLRQELARSRTGETGK